LFSDPHKTHKYTVWEGCGVPEVDGIGTHSYHCAVKV